MHNRQLRVRFCSEILFHFIQTECPLVIIRSPSVLNLCANQLLSNKARSIVPIQEAKFGTRVTVIKLRVT